ncbi:MAG: threonine dehydratase [Proteobacteria bacterium]|nr:threonine dehydratase [Pseudomonadota bacterium]
MPPSLAELEAAADLVHRTIAPTPQICWPLLSERCGCEVWVKHENHTPIGSFKVRGGLVYMDDLKRAQPDVQGVIAATRGNHGQSVAFAARAHGVEAVVVVPHGNSAEKNRAMRAFGAELVEQGRDFNEAFEHATGLAEERGLHMFPSFHPLLALGVGSYGLELLSAAPDLDALYVPLGLGSGVCGTIAARDALGLGTQIVGVVAACAPTYALSVAAGEPVPTESSDTLADGLAVRTPDARALDIIRKGAERVVTVTEEEILAAMRHYFSDTHNIAEGAGAAALAALLKERDRMQGRKVGLILSGGNLDRDLYLKALDEHGFRPSTG